jgi:hypothetical protein
VVSELDKISGYETKEFKNEDSDDNSDCFLPD